MFRDLLFEINNSVARAKSVVDKIILAYQVEVLYTSKLHQL